MLRDDVVRRCGPGASPCGRWPTPTRRGAAHRRGRRRRTNRGRMAAGSMSRRVVEGLRKLMRMQREFARRGRRRRRRGRASRPRTHPDAGGARRERSAPAGRCSRSGDRRRAQPARRRVTQVRDQVIHRRELAIVRLGNLDRQPPGEDRPGSSASPSNRVDLLAQRALGRRSRPLDFRGDFLRRLR